ncbi:MAG: DEAD/DEAH box helicase [Candidatus Aenigmatarchaeota archaeon]
MLKSHQNIICKSNSVRGLFNPHFYYYQKTLISLTISSMDIIKQVLALSGYKSLNPVQRLAIDAGLLGDKNLVVAAPTASGKTLIAEIAALKTIKEGKKVVYIVPLRALASEKYNEFRQKYSNIGIKIAISIGDYDSADPWLADYDMIIVTSEKLDSLLRHRAPWIVDIGLVIADEIHLLNSPDRGPTLEMIITRLRDVANPRILALSATISNYKELAGWLNAAVVKSDWRPVKLYRGICYDYKISFEHDKEIELDQQYPQLISLVLDTLAAKKQILIFLSTRKSAEAAAESIGKAIKLSSPELEKLAKNIEGVLERPTKQCHRLAACIRNGTAFHHAGLVAEQRRLIEDAFRDGLIKVIAATPTLAAGINMPAFRVVIRDLRRFSHYHGLSWIPVLEIEQMMGRAGRPQYDSEGQAILLAKDRGEARFAWENYIKGEPERITSKLGLEPILRMHMLALIASSGVITWDEIVTFFSKTFYAHQYKDISRLENILKRILRLLEGFGFIKVGERISATAIGRRVSELYIDPLTADRLIKGLKRLKSPPDIALLYLLSDCLEMRPGLSPRKRELKEILDIAEKYEGWLPKIEPWEIEYDDFLRSLKLALMLNNWIDEMGEDALLERFGITPGELRGRLEIADWLCYAAGELGLLLGMWDQIKAMRKLRIRLQYGVKEELLPLVRLKGIGRVRARLLYNAGLKRIADLRKAPVESLERLLGPSLARDIKTQVG